MGINISGNIQIIDAVPYRSMLGFLKNCSFLVTDSGGLQRESYLLGKRCLVRRETIGWSQLVDIGFNRLIKNSKADIENGLEWIEKKTMIDKDMRDDSVDKYNAEFVVEKSGQIALTTLANLT